MAANNVNGNGVHAELSSWQHYNQGTFLFTVSFTAPPLLTDNWWGRGTYTRRALTEKDLEQLVHLQFTLDVRSANLFLLVRVRR